LVLDVIRHTHEVTALAWEPNGARLATGSADDAIKIWDVGTGGELVTLRGHVQAVCSLAGGPGGSLASSANDGSLKIWSSLRDQESNVLPAHAGRATAVAWSPNGNQLASAGDDGMVKIWDVASRKVVRAVQAHDPGQAHPEFGLIHSLAWSPDVSCLASAGLDRVIRI